MTMQNRHIHMMGTIIQISVQHEKPTCILDKIVERLEEFDKRFSAHDSNSELMKVNNNAGIKPVKVHPELFHLMSVGKKHSTATNSYLNIAIGPLVQAWRIGFKDAHIPSNDDIRTLLEKTQAQNIILDHQARTVFLKQTDMFVDLGALAKGYIADLIIKDFKSMNVSAGLINLGGNVMTYGPSPKQADGYWRIGIQNPFQSRGNFNAILRAYDQSVVTSGIYERKSTINNRTYHHILDPKTGYPIETEIASLTIVSKESIDGEIWTGRLFGHTPQQIMGTLNQLPDVDGIVITKDNDMYYSDTLKPYLTETVS